MKIGKSFVDAGIQMQALSAKMQAATGDAKVAADALRFVREEAQRLGLDFRSTADGFASFAASALRSGLTLQETKDIFTGVSEAATGMRLSAERTSLVFIALSQMASKGTVSMEELKQQLGESLPGALQVFAKAMGVSNDQFIKMISNGQVTTRDLIKLGQGLKNEFGAAAQEAAQGAQAAFNRFGNALFDLQTRLANSGLLDAVVKGVQSLTEALNKPELVSGLSQLVTFLSQVMEVAVRVAAAIGSVVGAVNRAVEAVGNSVFSTLFGKEGADAIKAARGGQSAPVQVPVSPSGVDPKYSLGGASTPGISAVAQKAADMRQKLRDQVQQQNAGLISEQDPNKANSAEAIASLNKRYGEEQDLLEKALKKKAITDQEFKDNSLKVELDYQARLAEIRKQYRDDFLNDEQAFAEGFLGIEMDMQDKSLKEQGQSFRDSISQAASHNKTFFELDKAAAIAKALLSARQSIVDSYAFGAHIGGPPLGAVFAGVAAAAQAVNIAAIASTSFGGGGSVSSSGGGSGGGSADTSAADTASSSSDTGQSKSVYIELHGDDEAFYSKNSIRKLIEGINDALSDGTRLNVVVAS